MTRSERSRIHFHKLRIEPDLASLERCSNSVDQSIAPKLSGITTGIGNGHLNRISPMTSGEISLTVLKCWSRIDDCPSNALTYCSTCGTQPSDYVFRSFAISPTPNGGVAFLTSMTSSSLWSADNNNMSGVIVLSLDSVKVLSDTI